MIPQLCDAWRQLETSISLGDRLLARVAFPDVSPRLQCAIDSSSRRHLLIRLTSDEIDFRDNQSRGLTCQTRELAVHEASPGRYLDMLCSENTGHAMFDVIGAELAVELARPESAAPESVRRVLGRWRRFWAHPPQSLLTREEQLGLFAELWFIDVWLLPRLGPAEAVARWVGPSGARHDFSGEASAIEAKATTSTRGRLFRINGLEQLVPPTDRSLALFGMRLQEDSGATNCLPALVERLRTAMLLEAEALGRFETGLTLVGYSPVNTAEYEKLRLAVREEKLYRVVEGFPRLTRTDIAGAATLSAIERVEYDINLNGFDHLAVSNDAEVDRILK
jgi:hypothetical protein